jgi:hypothetical protein
MYRKFPKYDARNYNCSLFPLIKARHIHHTCYGGLEILRYDLLPLSVFGHWLIHGVAGGSIWMNKAVTRQNKSFLAKKLPFLFKYPNVLQRILHLWCRLPWLLKLGIIVFGIRRLLLHSV